MDWEFGVGRCKVLHLGWINKVLLYSNRERYSLSCDKHNGKNTAKNVYTCIT